MRKCEEDWLKRIKSRQASGFEREGLHPLHSKILAIVSVTQTEPDPLFRTVSYAAIGSNDSYWFGLT
jgi:hypothetical protein